MIEKLVAFSCIVFVILIIAYVVCLKCYCGKMKNKQKIAFLTGITVSGLCFAWGLRLTNLETEVEKELIDYVVDIEFSYNGTNYVVGQTSRAEEEGVNAEKIKFTNCTFRGQMNCRLKDITAVESYNAGEYDYSESGDAASDAAGAALDLYGIMETAGHWGTVSYEVVVTYSGEIISFQVTGVDIYE